MSSNNLSIENGSLDGSSDILSNKETQTSTAYITDSITLVKGPSRPLPKGVDKTDVEGTVDNLLHCRILKDPSDSKEEVLTESFIKDIANVSAREESGSQKERYCKEVVRPYLKPHLNDCEDSVDSLEKLIQGALEDQPCNEVFEGKQDIQDKTLGRTSKNRKMDTIPKTDDKKEALTKDNSPPKPCHKKSEEKIKPSLSPTDTQNVKKPCSSKPQLPAVAAEETIVNNGIQTSISAESIAQCIKESFTALKQTASTCLEKIEIVMGIKRPEKPGEKPTYYAIEKSQVKCNDSQNVQTETGNSLKGLKNLLHNHSDNIITIKEAVKDLADKFYKTSRDAMTSITSESAKFLTKDKTGAHDAENTSESQPKQKKKSRNTESFASFLFQKAENKPIINEPSNAEGSPESSAIESTPATNTPKTIIGQIANDIVNTKFDKSSPYDKPLPKEVANKMPKPEPPESRIPTVSAIDHDPDQQSASNMFMIIKSKIFSIFGNESEKIDAEIDDTNQEDEEEDPFERFMEQ